ECSASANSATSARKGASPAGIERLEESLFPVPRRMLPSREVSVKTHESAQKRFTGPRLQPLPGTDCAACTPIRRDYTKSSTNSDPECRDGCPERRDVCP